jgi:hypothetical protein
MTEIDNGLKDVAEIRSMMERSSKFLSLSGLSGIGAGIVAFIGWGWTIWYLGSRFGPGTDGVANHQDVLLIMLASVLVVSAAVAVSMFFSWRLARKRGLPIWNTTAKETLSALLIPLAAGGVFCVILVREGAYAMIPSAMLVFYGMALTSAGKFTVGDIRILGLCEIALGLAAGLLPGFGLWFWIAGFGLLHIVYGILMYAKYEK